MPKYLIQGSYSQQGLKGVLKEGGSKRREAAEQSIKGAGGRLEAGDRAVRPVRHQAAGRDRAAERLPGQHDDRVDLLACVSNSGYGLICRRRAS